MLSFKEKILFVIIVIICIILSFSICILFESKKYEIHFVECSLNKYLKDYSNDNYFIDLLSVNNKDEIQGIVDSNLEDKTIGMFKYDLNKDDFIFYKNNEQNQIYNIYIIENILYIITMEKKNDYYVWKLQIKNLKTNKSETIIKRNVIDDLDCPKFIFYNNNLYLVEVSDYIKNDYNYQIFRIEKIEYNKLNVLYEQNSSEFESNNELIYNMANIKNFNSKIYFTLKNNDEQYLMEYDLETNHIRNIYINNDKDYIILNYLVKNNLIYIQLLKNTQEDKSSIIIISNSEQEKIESKLLTFETFINNKIISHNKGNKWTIFNYKNNSMYDVTSDLKDNLIPKYLIVNDNIIVQTLYKKLFIGKIIEK